MADQTNESVQRFRQALNRVPALMRGFVKIALLGQGDRLVQAIKDDLLGDEDEQRTRALYAQGASPLRDSIRMIDYTNSESPSVLITAGGPLTTNDEAGGPYDYAMAREFGTVRQEAHPFFWPTYRRLKPSIRAAIKEANSFNGGKRDFGFKS